MRSGAVLYCSVVHVLAHGLALTHPTGLEMENSLTTVAANRQRLLLTPDALTFLPSSPHCLTAAARTCSGTALAQHPFLAPLNASIATKNMSLWTQLLGQLYAPPAGCAAQWAPAGPLLTRSVGSDELQLLTQPTSKSRAFLIRLVSTTLLLLMQRACLAGCREQPGYVVQHDLC